MTLEVKWRYPEPPQVGTLLFMPKSARTVEIVSAQDNGDDFWTLVVDERKR